VDATPQFPFPEGIRSQFNAEQLRAVAAFGGGMQNRSNSYKYDDKGRITERHRKGGVFDDEVTVTKYNDHGEYGYLVL